MASNNRTWSNAFDRGLELFQEPELSLASMVSFTSGRRNVTVLTSSTPGIAANRSATSLAHAWFSEAN